MEYILYLCNYNELFEYFGHSNFSTNDNSSTNYGKRFTKFL